MEYGPGDTEKYQRRLRKQRGYQRTRRDVQADEGIPERDDVAKVVLVGILGQCARDPKVAEAFIDKTAGRLTQEVKRFDKDRSVEVLRAMIERHRLDAERQARRRAADRRRET